MVFSKILQTRGCRSGYYCPDAFTETACPSGKPWSPPNSAFLSNCTCAMGTYLSAATGGCVPCTSSCALSGQYLPLSQCMNKNGAVADGVCLPCTNIPSANAQGILGSGVELLPLGGICSFQCNSGYQLHSNAGPSGICSYTFACIPPTALPMSSGGKYVFYDTVKTGVSLPLDSFVVSTVSCTPVLSFTSTLAELSPSAWTEQPDSCIGLCDPSQPALQLCYAANATASIIIDPQRPWYGLTASVNCTRCPRLPLLPVGSQLIALKNNNFDTCHQPQVACIQDGYYFNGTAWACQSCKDKELQMCSNTTRLRGMGCLGNYQASMECVQCPLRMPDPSIRGQTYLNYNSGANGICAIQNCASLQRDYFWSVACAGDVGGTQMPCRTTNCPAGQYSASACTAYADVQCTDCTQKRPGYYKTYNCSLAMDSGWQVCGAGFYCDGAGLAVACPVNRTSARGTSQASDCYCKVGSLEDVRGICVPMQCPGTVQDPLVPGLSLVSPYYMTLNAVSQRSTVCLPCGSTALTQGDGLELGSCTCPLSFYAALNGTAKVQCLPCASAPPPPVCQDPLHQLPPAPCPRSLVAPDCQCALAPFSALSAQQQSGASLCAQSSCKAGYMTMGSPRVNQGSAVVSGSPLYVAGGGGGWQVVSGGDYAVTTMATTGGTDDSQLSPQYVYRPEYVFWTVQYAQWPLVFAQNLLVAQSTPSTWEVYSNPVDWAGNTYTLSHVAVSRWDATHDLVYVAAVVSMRTLKVRGFYGQSGRWSDAAPVLNASLPPSQAIASITHAPNAIGSTSAPQGGFYYVAYNLASTQQCGGIALVSPIAMQVLPAPYTVCDRLNTPLASVAVSMDRLSGYPSVYVMNQAGALFQLDLPTGQLPDTPLLTSASSAASLRVLSQGIFLSILNANHQIQLADTLEWTWITDIPGMPAHTAPWLLSATGLTPSSTLLVSAFGTTLFSLRASICGGHYYWDGTACMPQTCVSIPHCPSNKVFVNSACVCMDGTYQLPNLLCSPCPKNAYCAAGVQTACPSTLLSAAVGGKSVNDCICASTGQFYSQSLSSCQTCLPNTYCPNQWLSVQCPGSGFVNSAGNQLPTQCACQAGFTGPSCAPCPAGFYCPSGTGATAFNMAGYFIGADEGMGSAVQAVLTTYFSTPGSVSAFAAHVEWIPPTPRTPQGLVVLVQLPDATTGRAWAQVVQAMNTTAVTMLPSSWTLMPVQSVSINPPTRCLTGKVPSLPVASACVCAPGYETSAQQCAPCAANTFKAAPGPGACAPCPLGTASNALGASACVTQIGAAPAAAASQNLVPLIAGVVGGVVGLVLLLYLLHFLCV